MTYPSLDGDAVRGHRLAAGTLREHELIRLLVISMLRVSMLRELDVEN